MHVIRKFCNFQTWIGSCCCSWWKFCKTSSFNVLVSLHNSPDTREESRNEADQRTSCRLKNPDLSFGSPDQLKGWLQRFNKRHNLVYRTPEKLKKASANIKTHENFTEEETTSAQAFNYQPTTSAQQVFNFRSTLAKPKPLITAKPQLLVNFPSSSSKQPFTGITLNYHPTTIPTPTEKDPVLVRPTAFENFNFFLFDLKDFTELPQVPQANPVVRLDFVRTFNKR